MSISDAFKDFGTIDKFPTINDFIWKSGGIDDRFMDGEIPSKNIIKWFIPLTHISAGRREEDEELHKLHKLPPTEENIKKFLNFEEK